MNVFDVIVIGGGTAGLTVARGARALGKHVLLIEKNKIGGDATHYGDIPTQTFIDIANTMHTIQGAKKRGITVSKPKISWKQLTTHIQSTVKKLYTHCTPQAIEKEGIHVVTGRGFFVDKKVVVVNDAEYTAKDIIIATGARPRTIPIPGLEDIETYTTQTIFSLKKQPKTLVILGAGPIGCTFAQTFSRLGTKVHLVTRKGILGREDEDVRAYMEEALRKENVSIHSGFTIAQAKKKGKRSEVLLTNGKKIPVDAVLVCAGKTPNTENLGLSRAKIKITNTGHVKVNRHLRTRNRHVWACGDCVTINKFTHKANEQGRIVVTNAFVPYIRHTEELMALPWVTYTDPQVAHVGMSERTQKGWVRTYKLDFNENHKAITDDDTRGFVKIVTRPLSGRILGATIISKHAGEMVGELSLAIKKNLRLKDLSEMLHPYPTRADLIKRVADKWYTEYLPELLKKIRGHA